jgi:Flp pilus assembly protein TadG
VTFRVRRGQHRGDSGTALIEFTWLALILLVPAVYVLLAVFDAQRASYGVSAASRSAGRAFVLSPDPATAQQRALDAARVAMADQGVEVSADAVTIRCSPAPDQCLTPGALVTVTVAVQQPLPLVPDVLGGSAPTLRVASTHSEPYGLFREDRS